MRVTHAAYGKDEVRVAGWPDGPEGEVRDLTISCEVTGDFLPAFEDGDNSGVLPSDTLRRHILDECARRPAADPSELVGAIAVRLVAAIGTFESATVTATVNTCGIGRPSGTRVVAVADGTGVRHSASVTGMIVCVRGGSSFAGFARDALTTQADESDRALVGVLDAFWQVRGQCRGPAPEQTARALVAAFAGRRSASVQELITSIGREALDGDPELAEIELVFHSAPLTTIGIDQYDVGASPIGISRVRLVAGPM